MPNTMLRTMTRSNVRWLMALALGAVAVSAVAVAPRFLRSHHKAHPATASICHDVTTDLPHAADAAPLPALPSGATAAELDSWIHPFDAQHHLVSHLLIDRMIDRPMDFARAARVVPALQDGRPFGFKLYAIKAGSFLERLGFENGDTLRAINGFDLTEPDKALMVYAALRAAKSYSIEIVRKGEPMQLTIVVE
jgi:general secretion pathway protein C